MWLRTRAENVRRLAVESCFGHSREGTNFLSEFLESNETLEDLTVDCGVLGHTSSVERFSNAMRGHSALEKVELTDCSFHEQNFPTLFDALKDKTEVSIRREYPCCLDNKMEEVRPIPSVLATNPQLQKLFLRGTDLFHYDNAIRDCNYDTINAFAAALSTNSNLKHIIFMMSTVKLKRFC
mgnify:CR=1 FL=1